MKAASKVVGMKAGGREHIVAHSREGDPVLLVPEPTNRFDPNAIAVYTAPRAALRHPVVSSVNDGVEHVGMVDEEDRLLLMDRQAGYIPKELASQLDLPPQGIVGWVSQVRWHPPEIDRKGQPAEPRVAGFDVTAWFTRRDDAEISAAIDQHQERTAVYDEARNAEGDCKVCGARKDWPHRQPQHDRHEAEARGGTA